ncbi:hypothetical protein [Caldalkalibacillus salinus]|uniref:hypothetical protein n=1 Tax=Caldalkalibacillus salinus TaxID=2803787 RepID=UPI001921D89F|nr:hypothetical protein [Caldalkalibacillus salinus]
MSWFVLGSLIGVFLGAGLAKCVDDEYLSIIDRQKWKSFVNAFLIFSIFFTGVVLYLIQWHDFDNFKYIKTVGEIPETLPASLDLSSMVFYIIFSSPVLHHLVNVVFLLLFLMIILLLIKAPFIRWEHIKLLGLEAKTVIKEKAERQAKEELDYMFMTEHLRLDTIELFSSTLTYHIIDQHIDVENRQFNGKDALEELLDSYSILYRESKLNAAIRFGVYTIHHNDISVSDYEEFMKLPEYLKEDIRYVMKSKTSEKWNHGEIYTFVTPISFLDDDEVFYIIYLSSYEIEFNNLTEKQFVILKNLIENYIRLSDCKNFGTTSQSDMVQ